MILISVLIPCHNEEKNPYFYKNLETFQTFPEIEVILLDGNSSDRTKEIAALFSYKWISVASDSSRAGKFNRGAREARGSLLLLHHPRSEIDPAGLSELLESSDLTWGGFRHRFKDKHWILSFTSWYSNNVRSRLFKIVYLDHCIFVQKAIFDQIGGFDDRRIFEDTLLCRKLRKIAAPKLLSYHASTSALRFRKNGYLFQGVLNQFMKLGFFVGLSDAVLEKLYERGLFLNGRPSTKSPPRNSSQNDVSNTLDQDRAQKDHTV